MNYWWMVYEYITIVLSTVFVFHYATDIVIVILRAFHIQSFPQRGKEIWTDLLC